MRKQTSVLGSPEVHRSVLRSPFPARRSAVSSHLFWLPGSHTSAQNLCCRIRKPDDFSYGLPPREGVSVSGGGGYIPRTLQRMGRRWSAPHNAPPIKLLGGRHCGHLSLSYQRLPSERLFRVIDPEVRQSGTTINVIAPVIRNRIVRGVRRGGLRSRFLSSCTTDDPRRAWWR
jgi:hypothetical protein